MRSHVIPLGEGAIAATLWVDDTVTLMVTPADDVMRKDVVRALHELADWLEQPHHPLAPPHPS